MEELGNEREEEEKELMARITSTAIQYITTKGFSAARVF